MLFTRSFLILLKVYIYFLWHQKARNNPIMETYQSNTISILNNDDNPSFAVRPSRPSRYRTPTISYTRQQFRPWGSSATHRHNPRGDSSIVQSGSPRRFHVDSTLSSHAMMNH